MIALLPPQVLAALIVCLVALIAMGPAIVREGSAALLARSAARSNAVQSEAALVAARAASRSADAAMRAAEANASLSDREELRRERREDRAAMNSLRERVGALEAALLDSNLARAMAEEQRADEARARFTAEATALAMYRDFSVYHRDANAENARVGRPPKRTPAAFARFDDTTPFGHTLIVKDKP